VSTARKLFFYAAMWAATGLAILAGIELVLPRFAPATHLSHHRWGNRPHTLLPGVVHRAASSEYDVSFPANALGFNDRDHAPAKAPGVFRVLLLGDSFVEAYQVPPERNLARRLEDLAARDGRALEVVAMGISGWGQSHELATYESLGRGFRPDLVILLFCPNDLWNNLVGVEGENGPAVYDLDRAGNLVSNLDGRAETPPTPAEYRKHERKPRFPGLREARRLLRTGYRLATGDARGAARAAALGELPAAARRKGKEGREGGDAGGRLRGPPGVALEQQRMFETLVAELRRRIVDRDGTPLLAGIVSGNVRAAPSRRYLRMTSWVAHTFAALGVDVLDFDTLFRERARLEGRFPSWEIDRHWNETGHAWAAEALYAKIAPLLPPLR
jgi:hypothetical protein